jgi:hypothetical protein
MGEMRWQRRGADLEDPGGTIGAVADVDLAVRLPDRG